MSKCKSCGAPIEWAAWAVSGKAVPLDVEPDRAFWERVDAGVAPDLRGKLVVIAGKVWHATETDVRLRRPLRVSHFATCPDAAEHRRPR